MWHQSLRYNEENANAQSRVNRVDTFSRYACKIGIPSLMLGAYLLYAQENNIRDQIQNESRDVAVQNKQEEIHKRIQASPYTTPLLSLVMVGCLACLGGLGGIVIASELETDVVD